MFRRTTVIIALAALTVSCSGGGGSLNTLLEQVRLGDPLADQTYAENREAIETPASIPTLTEHLENDPDADVRAWCALLLGRIGDPQAVPALTAALSDSEADVRDRAVTALMSIDEAEAESAFIEALRSGNRDARITVLVELEKASSVAAIPAIADVGRANDGMVSRNAIDTLGGIGDPSVVAPLVELALDTSLATNLRRAAIMNLGRIDSAEAEAGLQEVIAGLGEQEDADALVELARSQD